VVRWGLWKGQQGPLIILALMGQSRSHSTNIQECAIYSSYPPDTSEGNIQQQAGKEGMPYRGRPTCKGPCGLYSYCHL
jgi:hypothetical protein